MNLIQRLIQIIIITIILSNNSYSISKIEFQNIFNDTLFNMNYENYFVYYIDNDFISTCVDGKMNILMKQNMTIYQNSLHLVVVSDQSYFQNIEHFYHDYFLTNNIYFDTDNSIKNLLSIKCEAELLCFDRELNLVYYDCGFTNSPNYLKSSIFIEKLKLELNLNHPILDINKAISVKDKYIYIFDKITNSIHIYSFLNGNFLKTIYQDREFFKKDLPNDLPKEQINLFKLYNSQKLNIPAINYIFYDKSEDNVYFDVSQLKNFIESDSKFHPMNGLSLYSIGSEFKIKPFLFNFENNLFDELNIIYKNGEIILFDALELREDSSIYTLVKYNNKTNKFEQLFDQNDIFTHVNNELELINYNFKYLFNRGKKNEFIVFNENSNIFLLVDFINGDKVIRRIQPKEKLERIFIKNKINDELSKKYKNDFRIIDKFEVETLFYDYENLFVLIKDKIKTNTYYIQIYSNEIFLKEIQLDFTSSTDIVNKIEIIKGNSEFVIVLLHWNSDEIEIGKMKF